MAEGSAQVQEEPAKRAGDTEQGAQPSRAPAHANNAPAATNSVANSQAAKTNTPSILDGRFTAWTFGELPELMEITRGQQTLIGFPALVDVGDAVCIEVFDEPDVAATKHRAGLRRLFGLQIKDALKYLEKNLPDLQKMSVAFMSVGKSPDGSGGGRAGAD